MTSVAAIPVIITKALPSAAVTHVPAPLRGLEERCDAYPAVARFDRRRVIRCRLDLQWILQRHKGGRWRDLAYCRDKDVLLERIGLADPRALAVIAALPPLPPGPTAREVRRGFRVQP